MNNMTSFEKGLVSSILKANLNGDFDEVFKMIEGTRYEKEMQWHGATVFQVISRVNARAILRNWVNTGVKPVATQTIYDEDGEGEVYKVDYVDYYTCIRPYVESSFLSFYPHFEEEAKEMGLELVETKNGFDIVDPILLETKYERLAREFGYAA